MLKLALDAQADDRLQAEAEVLRRLNNPRIVQLLDDVRVGPRLGLLLPYAEKGTLAQRLRTEGRLQLEFLQGWVRICSKPWTTSNAPAFPTAISSRTIEAKTTTAREVGDIPVPPRYASTGFRKQGYWRLRGKLDVPKERFIAYPGLKRGADLSPVIGWAGWGHLQQAQALGTAFHELREKEGWGADRLAPLLAGLLELVPWLLQWHNEPDPAHGGTRLGDFLVGFLDEEARSLGLTREVLESWRPAVGARKGRRARTA